MYQVSAHAVRYGRTVEVTVIGFLPTSCHQARITDVYPGGNIMYIKDPGVAQVFVEEVVRPGTIFCAMVLIPWMATTTIADGEHDKVSVLVNHVEQCEVPIEDKGKAKFIVLQLTGGIVPNGAFSIVPASTIFPSIYTVVFGPDSYAACDAWIEDNESKTIPVLDGVALGYGGGGTPHGFAEGGGSGNPHGLRRLIELGKSPRSR